MSHFLFIKENSLRTNLDITLDHISHLLGLAESKLYQHKTLLVSSLRKTIIIHTASIIEALLLWELKQQVSAKKIELSDEWKYQDIKIIHKFNQSEQIVAGKRKKELKALDQLDFVRIIDLCYKHKVVEKRIFENLNKVRKLRNKLHLGNLRGVEKLYTPSDLKFVFQIAKKTKEIVRK